MLDKGDYGWNSRLFNSLGGADLLATWPNGHFPNSEDFEAVRAKLIQQNLLNRNIEAARDLYLSDLIKAAQEANIPLQNLPAWYAPAAAPKAARGGLQMDWGDAIDFDTAAAMARPKAAPAIPMERVVWRTPFIAALRQQFPRQFSYYEPEEEQNKIRVRDGLNNRLVMTVSFNAAQMAVAVTTSNDTKNFSTMQYALHNAKVRLQAYLDAEAPAAAAPAAAAMARPKAAPAKPSAPPKLTRQRRTAADSAALFPKRCVGETYRYKVDKPQTPVVTIISPLCKQPMVVTSYKDSYDVNTRHWLSAPDKSVVYAGGYEGQSYEDKYIDGADYARQHMLPGVLNYNDRGKGCGPASYMAGPFVARRRDSKFAGVYSYFGGRSKDAEAAWFNLIAHKTAEIRNESGRKETEVKLLPLVKYAGTSRVGGTPVGYALSVQPAKANVTTIDDGDTVITLKHMLEIGFVLDMAPEVENTLPDVRQPFVPSPEIWKELDLSATDDASLEKMLKFCASRYAKHGGNIAEGDYLYAAALNVAENPSLLMNSEDAKEWAATFTVKPKGSKAKPKASRAKKQNPDSGLSAFLNDESWAEYGGVKNPRRR